MVICHVTMLGDIKLLLIFLSVNSEVFGTEMSRCLHLYKMVQHKECGEKEREKTSVIKCLFIYLFFIKCLFKSRGQTVGAESVNLNCDLAID